MEEGQIEEGKREGADLDGVKAVELDIGVHGISSRMAKQKQREEAILLSHTGKPIAFARRERCLRPSQIRLRPSQFPNEM